MNFIAKSWKEALCFCFNDRKKINYCKENGMHAI